MLCGYCGRHVADVEEFRDHRRIECQREGWRRHLDAKDRGKVRKARRVAGDLLGVERVARPMPAALVERFRNADPMEKKAAAHRARMKNNAIREAKANLSALARRRRRILL